MTAASGMRVHLAGPLEQWAMMKGVREGKCLNSHLQTTQQVSPDRQHAARVVL